VTHHQQWGYDPVHKDAEYDLYPEGPLFEYQVQCLISYFAEDRVHHDKQAEG
jgi:hypothetical protein